jgi:TM2 domain-containing membrane protein YozV
MSISKKGPIGQLELFEIPYFVLVLLIGYMKFLFPFLAWLNGKGTNYGTM